MKAPKLSPGASLKQLRTSTGVSQPLVAAMVGTSTAYLARVEDGVFTPADSYVGKVTQAIIRLMEDPPRPCPTLGCDSAHHVDSLDGSTGSPESHHADCDLRGDGWAIEVRRHDGQDTEWVVYVEIDDGYALSPTSFLEFTDAYKQASAYAAVLNGHGAEVPC